MDENLEYGYYDDTEILPTIDISKLNRKEVKNLARTIAGRENPQYGLTYKEVLNDKANIVGKFSRQEDRFKRLVKKQYKNNVRHTQQIDRAKKAGEGDVQAMQNYITTGTTEASKYLAPLVFAPAVASAATSGALGTAAKGVGSLLSKGYIRWPLEAIGTGDFIYRNATGQGFQKTANKFREGDIWGGLGSASLDVLDSAGIIGAGYDLYKASKLPKYVKQFGRIWNPGKTQRKIWELNKNNEDYSRQIDKKMQDIQAQQASENLQYPSMSASVYMTTQPAEMQSGEKIINLTLPNGEVTPMKTVLGHTGTGIKEYPVFDPTGNSPIVPIIQYDQIFKWFPPYRAYAGPVGKQTISGLQNIPLQASHNPQFSKYLIDTQATMGNSGVIGGSSILFDKGYISGVPHDLEIVTTKSRQADLAKRIGFIKESDLPLAQAGVSNVSASSELSEGKRLTDVQIIDEDSEGFAIGKLAHELYRILHPEDHVDYISNLVKRNFNNPLASSETFRLPKKSGGYYTADELLDEYLQSGAMTRKTLVDALSVAKSGASYSENPTKLMRPIGILSNTDPNLQPEILDAIHTLGKINLGKDYKTIRDLYPNIDFSDIAKNEQFLEALGFDKSLATNPQAMENITEYYHLQLSGSQRVYDKPTSSDDIVKFAYPTKNWNGGSASGAGGNSTIGTAAAFDMPYRSMGQFPIVKSGETVKSPLDILNKYNNTHPATLLSDFATPDQIEELRKLGLNIDNSTTLGDIDQQLIRIHDEDVTESVGDILDIYGLFGSDYSGVNVSGYVSTPEYFGRYSKKPVASSYRIVSDSNGGTRLNYELGRILHKYKQSTAMEPNPTEFYEFVQKMQQTFDDFLSGKISEQTGIVFTKGDYDKIKEYEKQLKNLQSKQTRLYGRSFKLNMLESKYMELADKLDKFINKLIITGASGLSVAGVSGLVKSQINNKNTEKYLEDFMNTDEYKDSYYHKMIQDPRFDPLKNENMSKSEGDHILKAWKEVAKDAKKYGNQRRKEDRQTSLAEFLSNFSKFQPTSLGILVNGK